MTKQVTVELKDGGHKVLHIAPGMLEQLNQDIADNGYGRVLTLTQSYEVVGVRNE